MTVAFVLKIQNALNSCMAELLHIILWNWTISHINISWANLAKFKLSSKIPIYFVDFAIDYPDFTAIEPAILFIYLKLASIEIWILYFHDSAWLTLPLDIFMLVIIVLCWSFRVVVSNEEGHFLSGIPYLAWKPAKFDFLSVFFFHEPIRSLVGFNHTSWTIVSPISNDLQVSVDLDILVLFEQRIEYLEVYMKVLPNVIDSDLFYFF